jgi:MSHA pilin protein MshC
MRPKHAQAAIAEPAVPGRRCGPVGGQQPQVASRAGGCGGFSLVELIVVMLVMAVLAAVALPRLTDRTALQERGFRDQLKAMIDHSRKLATVQQRDVCVLLSATQARAVYTTAGACAPGLPVAEPAGTAPFVLAVPTGVLLGGSAQLRFNSRGQPVPNANATISLGSLALSVGRETGIVR